MASGQQDFLTADEATASESANLVGPTTVGGDPKQAGGAQSQSFVGGAVDYFRQVQAINPEHAATNLFLEKLGEAELSDEELQADVDRAKEEKEKGGETPQED